MGVATETPRKLGVVKDGDNEPGAPTGEAGDGKADDVDGAQAEAPRTPPMQIPIPGTSREITNDPGGSLPTATEVRLLGGSLPLEGQFDGEEVVQLLVEAKIGEVAMVYATDAYGQTKSVTRRHKARMISVERVGTKPA